MEIVVGLIVVLAVTVGVPVFVLVAWRTQRLIWGKPVGTGGWINRAAHHWFAARERQLAWRERWNMKADAEKRPAPNRTLEEVDARAQEARKRAMTVSAPALSTSDCKGFRIRVSAKTEPAWRTLMVPSRAGSITCDCGGFDGHICSHIDAVLLCGESFMVHPEDRHLVQAAVEVARGRIDVPETWRGSWKRDHAWRGLDPAPRSPIQRSGNRPLVCFTGTLPMSRAKMIAQAKAHGWDVVDSPSRFTDVLVTGSPNSRSAKMQAARDHGTPIISAQAWEGVMETGDVTGTKLL